MKFPSILCIKNPIIKKTIFIIATLFLAVGLGAQEKFEVPEIPLEKKFNRTVYQFNSLVAVNIAFAKSQGISVTEYGKYVGDHFKTGWNKEAGFNGLAKGIIFNWTSFFIDPQTEILEQSHSKVIIKTRLLGLSIKNNEPVYGISHDEYMQFVKSATGQIASHLGCSVKFKTDDTHMTCIIKKK